MRPIHISPSFNRQFNSPHVSKPYPPPHIEFNSSQSARLIFVSPNRPPLGPERKSQIPTLEK